MLVRPLAENVEPSDSLTLIVGRSEKFTDKYVDTVITIISPVILVCFDLERVQKHLKSPGNQSTREFTFFLYTISDKGHDVLSICSHTIT